MLGPPATDASGVGVPAGGGDVQHTRDRKE